MVTSVNYNGLKVITFDEKKQKATLYYENCYIQITIGCTRLEFEEHSKNMKSHNIPTFSYTISSGYVAPEYVTTGNVKKQLND